MPGPYRRLHCDLCGAYTARVIRTALATVCTGCVEVLLERALADVAPHKIAAASVRAVTEAPRGAFLPTSAAPVFPHQGRSFGFGEVAAVTACSVAAVTEHQAGQEQDHGRSGQGFAHV